MNILAQLGRADGHGITLVKSVSARITVVCSWVMISCSNRLPEIILLSASLREHDSRLDWSVASYTLGDPPTVTGSKFREFVAPSQDRKIFDSRDSVIRTDYLSGKQIFGVLNRI